jgi:hypothetical protein
MSVAMDQEPLPDRVAHLRTAALDVLEDMVGDGLPADPVLAATVADLQEAANRLGAATSALSAPRRGDNGNETGTEPSPSQDAAIVLALASTTIPFAVSPLDEAERWARALRLHGRVGAALEELGVERAPLDTMADPAAESAEGCEPTGVAEVARRAAELARARGAETLDTVDILFAVADLHRARFERALYARGTTLSDLLDHLPSADRAPAQG